jgi:hypothetical protein
MKFWKLQKNQRMIDFILKEDTVFAVEIGGIAVLNKTNKAQFFIAYPGAAVWSVLAKKNKAGKTLEMLMAILGKSEKETVIFVDQCILNWKAHQIIE